MRMLLSGVTLALVAVSGCKDANKVVAPTVAACIQPPASDVAAQVKLGGEIAANLAKIPIDAKLKSEFESVLKADFPKLSDRNASLLLFLRAIDCYMKNGPVGEEIAREMAKMVREEWSRQTGFRNTDGPLTPLEKEFIKQSKAHSTEILERLANHGLN